MILYLRDLNVESWLSVLGKTLTDTLISIDQSVDFGFFLENNKMAINRYSYLLVDIAQLLDENGEIDSFALREYDCQPILIIFNYLQMNLTFMESWGIKLLNSATDCQRFFNQLGMVEESTNKSVVSKSQSILMTEEKLISSIKAEKSLQHKDKTEKNQMIDKATKQLKMENMDKNRERKSLSLPKIGFSKFKARINGTDDELSMVDQRQEIGFIGSTRGVGTTFVSFYYAQKYATTKKTISLILCDDIEVKILNQSGKHGKINVFTPDDIREALVNDIIIYDFGVLDRDNLSLMQAFERCAKRYVVTSLSFHKKYSINNILQYHNETSLDFSVIFNFVADENLPLVKKTFQDLDCENLEFMANL